MQKSILSDRIDNGTARLNVSGRIRCGTKALTAKARSNPQAVALFAPALAGQIKFKDVETAIAERCHIPHPTRPINTQYFNVNAADFEMPEFAKLILERHGEIRGDGPARLYRFPIVFHTDQLLDFFPHAFKAYGGSVNYESRYGHDGKRYCMYREPVSPEQIKQQRAQRMKFMPRRDLVPRGDCVPETCQEYMQGLCKFHGELHFYVPGIPTVGPVVMGTTSQYAAEGIFSDLMRIKAALGTIPRFNPFQPGKPIYWLTKVQETRTYYDEEGNKRLGLQWVPKLTADLDMAKALSLSSASVLAGPGASTVPAAWLAAPTSCASTTPAAAPVDESGAETAAGSSPAPEYDPGRQAEVLRIVNDSNGDPEVISRWAGLRYGDGWSTDDVALRGVQAVFTSLGQDGEYVNARLSFEIAALQSGIEDILRKRYFKAKLGNGWTHDVTKLCSAAQELAALAARGANYASSLMLGYLDDQKITA
ncbi:hypothetical protein BKK79_37305 (plasmid) [Cupriavidus sp. USMAA2-4]|uniref:recombination directionality factor n=1 Tax=Cupriavidus sp. USMAA2-4 TaxID=876364 RepID=UPI0008A6A832|nr:hypothetical protein [Cupriavidus sp. USMAA2-4]AOY97594.1 hypothetical protein BKK79_37305 [Cupriavidus sp. USMAA2-4]